MLNKSLFALLAMLIGLATSLFSGCLQCTDSPSKDLRKILKTADPTLNIDSLHAIMVITEQGCLPCSKAFAELATAHLDNPAVIFWVCATGQGIDISPFRDSQQNTYWDNDDLMSTHGVLDGSGAILLESGTIDTIIPMQAQDLQSSLEYVTIWLDEKTTW